MLDSHWNGWKIDKKIGEGRFGEVYKAVKTIDNMNLSCAIKHASLPKNDDEVITLIKRGFINNRDDANKYFFNLVENMKKEISIMQKFNGVPYIIDCFDYTAIPRGDNSGIDFYIRMELAQDLNEYTKNKTLEEIEVIKIGIDICKALELCEKEKIIHRDIKPSNIFIGADGIYKLGDFGIASGEDVEIRKLSGTYSYMAPELYNNKILSASTDIYSLGLVMYKLLNNNKLPFVNKEIDENSAFEIRMLGRKFPTLKKVNKNILKIINKACNFNPKKRYDKASEMRKELENIYNLLKVDTKDISEEKTVSIYDIDKTKEIANSFIVSSLEKRETEREIRRKNMILLICGILSLILIIMFLKAFVLK